MILECNWADITSTAYSTLLELNIQRFPIPDKSIKCKGVKIVSYREYSEKTGCDINEITQNHELEDAFLLREIRPGKSLILYNNEIYDKRKRYTLWHEIGHIKCAHRRHGDQEEVEANFFASQVLAPNALIHEIARRGYSVNISSLVRYFGLSNEAAKKKRMYLKKI